MGAKTVLQPIEETTYKHSMNINIGDIITFERKGLSISGKVTRLRENSVMVEIDLEIAKELDYPNNYTVVNYRHIQSVQDWKAGNNQKLLNA
ncbi:DUF2187 family protein [Bacillus testis]|uniref:DUF2187 family protein n=1 Tax=Bacillus testis TaxID=1622072 RepID=UPI00067F58D8|nr:DUF2187 family protein [Bacillus testis]